MGVIAWIVFGLLAGFVTKQVYPEITPPDIMVTFAVALIGAALGGIFASQTNLAPASRFTIRGVICAVAGSILAFFVYSEATITAL